MTPFPGLIPRAPSGTHSVLLVSHPCSHTKAFLQPSVVAVATVTALSGCVNSWVPGLLPWGSLRLWLRKVWLWLLPRNRSGFCKPHSGPLSAALLSEGCPSDHPHETAPGTGAVRHSDSPVCPSHRHCHRWGCRWGRSCKWGCPSPWGQCHLSHSGCCCSCHKER